MADPGTAPDAHDPLILTAQFDPCSQAFFHTLRDAYFPPARNIVPAHLTLFHHLPHDGLDSIESHLAELAGQTPVLRFRASSVRFLGNGCALTIDAPALGDLRAALAARWTVWLTAQDRQPFHPHVTVQNKVPAETARATCLHLQKHAVPVSGRLIGMELWHYRQGPWEHCRRFAFANFATG